MTDKLNIEKEVWESTLHRSMVLQAENETLKELLKSAKEIIKLYLKWYEEDCGCKDIETEEMNAKINQALGEDK